MKGRAFLNALTGMALFFLSTGNAPAATFTIANGDVSGLKNAINTANTNGEDDTIELAANGNYVLTVADNFFYDGSDGLPTVKADGGKKLVIKGNSATIQRSTASGTGKFVYFISSLEAT